MIHVLFPFVLDYHLVEGFSLTQSSIHVLEDDGSSLMTYQGLFSLGGRIQLRGRISRLLILGSFK